MTPYTLPEPYATLHHDDGYFSTKQKEHDIRYSGPLRTDVFTADQMHAAYAAGLAAGKVPEGWKPIESAPKDGLPVLLCTDGGVSFVGKLNKHLQLWVDDEGRERFRTVRYWMPLPAAPEPSHD